MRVHLDGRVVFALQAPEKYIPELLLITNAACGSLYFEGLLAAPGFQNENRVPAMRVLVADQRPHPFAAGDFDDVAGLFEVEDDQR